MRSSSTDPFLPQGSGAWVRLALVLALGAAAVAGPVIDRTGAIYTDVETVGLEVVGPVPSPTPSPTASSTASPTEEATAEAAAAARQEQVVSSPPAPDPTTAPGHGNGNGSGRAKKKP